MRSKAVSILICAFMLLPLAFHGMSAAPASGGMELCCSEGQETVDDTCIPSLRVGGHGQLHVPHIPSGKSGVSLTGHSNILSGGSRGRVALVVEHGLYPHIEEALQQHVDSLALDSLDSLVLQFSGTAEELRGQLAALHGEPASLVGAKLIGDLPHVIYEMYQDWGSGPVYETFPCDIFFMDLDGTWLDIDGNGYYDTWSGHIPLEIWVSRMRVDNLAELGSGPDILNHYFGKNRAYRNGELRPAQRALVYNDDDWVPRTDGDATNLRSIYGLGNVTAVSDTTITTAQDYMANRMPADQELILTRSHGWPGGHSYYHNGTYGLVLSSDYRDTRPPALFYHLFVCSGTDFTHDDYLAGTVAFNMGDSGLLSWGSTKSGGMRNDHFFYQALASGKDFGAAFVDWFNEIEVRGLMSPQWYYGMSLIGDASLRPSPFMVNAKLGTMENPYPIRNVWELQNMTGNLSRNYALANDIDAGITSGWGDAGFMPVGMPEAPFNGSLNGRGFSITGLFINRSDMDFQGLFGHLGAGGLLTDVCLVDAHVAGHQHVGGLVGWNNGTVINSQAGGRVTGMWDVGGLIGWNNGTLDRSHASCNVSGGSVVGGLLGFNDMWGLVFDSYSIGEVSGNGWVGGLIGYNQGESRTSYAAGPVNGNSDEGGLIGESPGPVLDCFYDWEASGQCDTGKGEPRSTAEMMERNTFTDAGWNFAGTWDIQMGLTYPLHGTEAPFAGGSGSPCDPYLIRDVWGLQAMRDWPGAHYALANDIDASEPSTGWNRGAGFEPVGTLDSMFTGSLDGRGHSISSLRIHRPGTDRVGLLGCMGELGHVRDLSITDCNVTGASSVGSLAGQNLGTLKNVSVSGEINGASHVGGIAGNNGETGLLNHIRSIANVTGCAEDGFFVGGVAGYNSKGTVEESLFAGNAQGHDGVGGLVGLNYAGSIVRSHSVGNTSGKYHIGGIVGSNDWGTVTDTLFSGVACGDEYVGGIAGQNTHGLLVGSRGSGSVNGTDRVGGLVGYNLWGTVTGSQFSGAVTGNQCVGGLVGEISGGDLSMSHNSGSVSGTGDDIGGGVGRNANAGTISESYSTGDVTGAENVGGLVGWNSYHVINCYATGNVAGTQCVGGLAGYSSSWVIDSYATGRISGPGRGLVGWNNFGAVSNSFYDRDTTGRSDTGCGVPKTTPEMMNVTTFVGWDFDSVWWMIDGGTRPFLRMEWSAEIRNPHQLQLMQMNLTGDYTLAYDIDLTGYITEARRMWGTDRSNGRGFVPVGNATEGFSGRLEGGNFTITGLYISRSDANHAGLLGFLERGLAANLRLDGMEITGQHLVGGIAGASTGTISQASVSGTVSGSDFVGGVAGRNDGRISESFSTASVSGRDYVGGIVGLAVSGSLADSSATGSVSGDRRVGGLVGYNRGVVARSSSAAMVRGDEHAGGVVGRNDGWIQDSHSSGQVNGTTGIGGAVGYNRGTITGTHASGDVTGYNFVGGFLGDNYQGTVETSYSTGNVSGYQYVGGMTGYNWAGSVRDSYSWGAVFRTSGDKPEFGGFMGRNRQGLVLNSYSKGSVHYQDGFEDPTDKGFVGTVNTTGGYEMAGCFWDMDTSMQWATGGNATGETTTAMKSRNTFAASGWDLDLIWYIQGGVTYPLLRWQPLPAASHVIGLSAGWNLISIPLETETSVDHAFQSISGIWDVAKYYDAMTRTWKAHRPGSPVNSLSHVDRTMGIWLHALEACNLTVSGLEPTSTAITLRAGWNLVGYPSMTQRSVADALWGTGANRVEAFSSESPYIMEVGPTHPMKPGEGYWVRVAADVVWVVDW